MIRATGLTLLLVAAAYAPITPLRDGRAALVLCGLLLFLACRWSNRWRLGVFVAALVAFASARFDPDGWAALFSLFLAGELIEWLRLQPAAVGHALLAVVAVIALAASLHGVVQGLQLDPTTYTITWDQQTRRYVPLAGRPNTVVAFMGDRNTYGAYLAVALPAVWLLSPWLLLGLMPGLMGATSTAPILTAGAAGLVLVFLTRWRWRWGLPPALVLGALAYIVALDFDASSWEARVGQWLWTLEHAGGVTGHGPGSFARLQLAQGDDPQFVWRHAHNAFVQWRYEAGTLGLLTVLGYLGWLGWRLLRAPRTPLVVATAAMLVALVAAASAHFIERVATTAVVAVLVLGVAESVGRPAPPPAPWRTA